MANVVERMLDISNWQNGINLLSVDFDSVIAKATQGTTYTSPDCDRQIQQAKQRGALWGVYHYIAGGNAKGEADFFIDSCKGYIKKGILAVDWEETQNSAWGDLSYLEAVIARIIDRTGVHPPIYCSAAFVTNELRALAKKYDCALWIAQYANNDATGWQKSPWNEGAYSCAIRQYTSHGKIDGWGGYLDLNKAYMTAEACMKYACPDGSEPEPAPELKPADPNQKTAVDLMIEVIEKNINGDERKTYLGERYREVQDLINHIAYASAADLADETWAGAYGNGTRRKAALGWCGRYDEVMAVINGQAETDIVYTVKYGDTLSAIASKYGTTVDRLASANGIADPDKIYQGQRIIIK